MVDQEASGRNQDGLRFTTMRALLSRRSGSFTRWMKFHQELTVVTERHAGFTKTLSGFSKNATPARSLPLDLRRKMNIFIDRIGICRFSKRLRGTIKTDYVLARARTPYPERSLAHQDRVRFTTTRAPVSRRSDSFPRWMRFYQELIDVTKSYTEFTKTLSCFNQKSRLNPPTKKQMKST
ncbi:hypothetical protein J2S05_001917 [Alkalicoccobacillus murimartini]|uniref:Uncharacterized protein n=1 Tax=Alkalicoccobacillus murimartini TaxID=171685 RepID=A0ABT9YHN8_9BACI|nr:hypothetical protein [Alkalicoccobacillus murimartini]